MSNDPLNDDRQWLSVSELAELKGKTRQTIWEKVVRLERDNLLVTKSGPQGTKLVNVAEYDRVTNETTDFAREQAVATRTQQDVDSGEDGGDPTYAKSQRRRMQYEADLKALELAERLGQLIRVDELNEAVGEMVSALIDVIETLPLRTDEVVAAFHKDGPAGVRACLKTIVFDLRAKTSEAWKVLEQKGLAEQAQRQEGLRAQGLPVLQREMGRE
jgi:biotin operon repressor